MRPYAWGCEKIWLFYRKKIITVDDILKLSINEVFEKRRKITQDRWDKNRLERATRDAKQTKQQNKRRM